MDPELQSFKPSFSFPDFTDPNFELMGHYSASNPVVLDNPSLNFTNLLPFSNDMFIPHHQTPPQFPQNLGDCNSFQIMQQPPPDPPVCAEIHEMKKRKPMDVSESSSGISTSETGLFNAKNVCIQFFKPLINPTMALINFPLFLCFSVSLFVCFTEVRERKEIEKHRERRREIKKRSGACQS